MKKLYKKLPDKPGVYIFRGAKRVILYIGKATSLHSRVRSYFRHDLMSTRGPIIVGMIETARTVDFIETDSVLEALILEAHLIKKYQPPYNTKEKDNKSFNYIIITEEEFPRVLTMRGHELSSQPDLKSTRDLIDGVYIKYVFGPFPQGNVLRSALSIIRKIFPFRDKCKLGAKRKCFNAQIGLCPGVCSGEMSRAEYAKTIRHIKLFLEGKKPALVRSLKRDMKIAAKQMNFEDALRIKRTIFALNHIQDVALLKHNFTLERPISGRPGLPEGFRVEAYDVAHISGTNTVGVMVVMEDGEVKKSDYRKFKIKTSTNDDNASLFEMLSRRFGHTEWTMPKLIVVDGGKAQVNTAKKALAELGLSIPVAGVVKDEHHRAREIIGNEDARKTYERAILLINSEAHRFAVAYHRNLRGKIR